MTLFPEEDSGLCEQTLNETIEGLSLLLEEMKIKNISQDFFRTVVVPLSVYFYSLEKREQPYFICFTGGQGSGKTTLSEFVQFVLAEDEEDDPWLDEYESILGPILDGLVHAFDRDIIHRDLKPANIFYMLDVREDEEGEATCIEVLKIGDFGAAKLVNMEVPNQATVVDLYTEPWTPHPSEKERLFQNTWDVFSWGVIAIALVTDKSPDTYEDTQRLLDTEFKQKIGENIHTLLARSVSQDPEQRPQNVKLLQKEILKLNKKRRKALGIE